MDGYRCRCGTTLRNRKSLKRHQLRCKSYNNLIKLKIKHPKPSIHSGLQIPIADNKRKYRPILTLKRSKSKIDDGAKKLEKMFIDLKEVIEKSALHDNMSQSNSAHITYNDNRVYTDKRVYNDNRTINIKTYVSDPRRHNIEPDDIIGHLIDVCGSKETAMKKFAQYFDLEGLRKLITDVYVPRMHSHNGYPWIPDQNGVGLAGKDALVPVICDRYSEANMRFLNMMYQDHREDISKMYDGSGKITKATRSAQLGTRWHDSQVTRQYELAVQDGGMCPKSAVGQVNHTILIE